MYKGQKAPVSCTETREVKKFPFAKTDKIFPRMENYILGTGKISFTFTSFMILNANN